MRRHGRLSTVASTGDAATRADALRDEDGSACGDRRWEDCGREHPRRRVTSALSFRLTVLDHSETTAALTIYSERPAAFDETSVSTGLVLATHASLLVTAMLARERADNLVRALESNREIGVAMGILMQRHRLTREQAFDVLRVASQDSNRKLAHIATEVADTGILAIRRWPPGTRAAGAPGATTGRHATGRPSTTARPRRPASAPRRSGSSVARRPTTSGRRWEVTRHSGPRHRTRRPEERLDNAPPRPAALGSLPGTAGRRSPFGVCTGRGVDAGDGGAGSPPWVRSRRSGRF